MSQINGKLSKFLYRNERNFFSTFLLNTGSEITTVTGYFPIAYPSLKMNIHGNWKVHKRFGKQFQATSYEVLAPESSQDLLEFLTSELMKTSRELAHRIVSKLGISYLEHYRDNAYCLKKLGYNESHRGELVSISQKLTAFYRKKELLEKMILMGFKQEIACKVAFSESPPSVDEITNNPYMLMKPFELDWKTVDGIALKNGISKGSKTRVQEGLFYLVDESAVQKGHMFLPQKDLEEMVTPFFNTSIVLAEELNELQSSGRIVRDFKEHVYSIENHTSECLLAENLHRIYHSKPLIAPHKIKFSKTSFPFSDEQKQSIQMAIDEQLSLISGPAGTGKTTVIREIIRQLNKGGHEIKLCAPTGAAAKQMYELTGMRARTIQHLLSFSPLMKQPTFHRHEPLAGTCFIIDEASMADVKISSFLADAIPEGAKLIIIGDVHQLPSVGPGRVLKDLLGSGFFPGIELSTVFRQSGESQILDYATKIRNGEPFDLNLLPSKTDFKFYVQNDPYVIRKNIEQLVLRFLKNGKYDVFEDLQVVTPIHGGPLGTKELNMMLQNLINPSGNEIVIGDKTFREGDKVVQTKNNYDKNIFNGETGKIQSVSKRGKQAIVVFNGKAFDYIDDELFELELAYAQTVHKVQGREIPFVIAPFHGCFSEFMLHRKLLYTLMTRAKQQLILIGQPEAFHQAALKDDVDVRYCNLIRRLKTARLKYIFK